METRVWAPFKRSYRAAIGVMRAHVEAMFDEAMDPQFSIKQKLEALPWRDYENTLLDPWEQTAAVMLARARTVELQAQKSVLVKARNPSSMDDLTLADRLAVEWLETRGLTLVSHQSARAKAAMLEVFRDGVANGWSVQQTVRAIRDEIGLHANDREALSAFKDRLTRSGGKLTARGIATRTEAYANRLIKQRAELIARTEIKSAVENGRLHAWREMQSEGELGEQAMRDWVPGTCGICLEIAAQGPIPLNQPFRSRWGTFWAPPAHPRCGCRQRIIRNPGLRPSIAL